MILILNQVYSTFTPHLLRFITIKIEARYATNNNPKEMKTNIITFNLHQGDINLTTIAVKIDGMF